MLIAVCICILVRLYDTKMNDTRLLSVKNLILPWSKHHILYFFVFATVAVNVAVVYNCFRKCYLKSFSRRKKWGNFRSLHKR